MSKKTNLPIPLNDIYFEPPVWRMPKGLAFVSILSPAEVDVLDCAPCIFIVRDHCGNPFAAFEFVSDALIMLTASGYDIRWRVELRQTSYRVLQ